jgi:hypothetical protein
LNILLMPIVYYQLALSDKLLESPRMPACQFRRLA